MVRPSPLIQPVHSVILKYKGLSSIATPVEKTPTSPDQREYINATVRNNSSGVITGSHRQGITNINLRDTLPSLWRGYISFPGLPHERNSHPMKPMIEARTVFTITVTLVAILLLPSRLAAQTNPLWHTQKVKNYLPHMTVPEVRDLPSCFRG